ncbi:GNAT family N-acetyltransferase [Deefgea tanakiae]|uniref:GNAT family N-acetyltransferase n=1 Tax=Deefgea tanakiae TaxID=2865840 RepID=A0ABX8Z360_9NEIS|nr:GNAT family N-acetyltransferase [Deefgea tanakiae]QZA77019.1 GNAT family N-acetyltransferase [Deefgea tanakiae]
MIIVAANSEHHESLTDLLYELHIFYNEEPTVTRAEVLTHLVENLLAPDSGLHLIVALDSNNTVVGLVALVLMYSLVESSITHRKQCNLKELYVRANYRNLGIGQALLASAANFALANGCGRMDWNVKASNMRGIKFYESLGGELVADRMSFRMSREQLSKIVQ